MAFLSGAASIISGVLGLVGAVVGGMEAANRANQQAENELAAATSSAYQSAVAKQNAAISERNAERSVGVAQREQQTQDDLTRAMIGEQIATQGASGLALGGRSQIMTRKSARVLGRKDALNVRYAGEVERYNYMVEAANQRAGAQLKTQEKESLEKSAAYSRRTAGMSLLAGFIQGAGSLVNSFSSFRYNPQRSFTPTPYAVPRSLIA